MIVLYLILLAVFQAVTEFIPVSSFGHLMCGGTAFRESDMTQDF